MAGILYGVKVSSFAHPDDLAAIRALKKAKAVDKLTAFIEDRTTQAFLQTTTLGSCVRISRRSNERIYNAVKDTCEILQYDQIPEIFIHRSFSVDVAPHGVDKPIIVLSDFVANHFDDNLLHFAIGRAITRFKSDYLKFYIAASGIAMLADQIQILSDAVKIPIANWMRKSELTADRGGLLACQNIHSAMKYLMLKSGMPLSALDAVNEIDYVRTCISDSRLVNAAKTVLTLSNCQGWSNDRIIELYNWYSRGDYDELLEEHME